MVSSVSSLHSLFGTDIALQCKHTRGDEKTEKDRRFSFWTSIEPTEPTELSQRTSRHTYVGKLHILIHPLLLRPFHVTQDPPCNKIIAKRFHRPLGILLRPAAIKRVAGKEKETK